MEEFVNSIIKPNSSKKIYARGAGALERLPSRMNRFLSSTKILYNEESVKEVVSSMK